MTLTILFDPVIARHGDGGCVETHAGQQFWSAQINILGCEKRLLLLFSRSLACRARRT
jgi:hypothetical protein